MPDYQVVGVVPNEAAAEQVVGNLRLQGYPQDDISIIMVKHEEAEALENVDDQTGQGAQEVAASAAKGAAIGGGAGVLAGLATLAIPGIGPIVGSGILVALFGGSGAFVGALSGAFATEDVSTQVITKYGMALREGQAVIAVKASDAEGAKQLEETLAANGVASIRTYFDEPGEIADATGLKDITQ